MNRLRLLQTFSYSNSVHCMRANPISSSCMNYFRNQSTKTTETRRFNAIDLYNIRPGNVNNSNYQFIVPYNQIQLRHYCSDEKQGGPIRQWPSFGEVVGIPGFPRMFRNFLRLLYIRFFIDDVVELGAINEGFLQALEVIKSETPIKTNFTNLNFIFRLCRQNYPREISMG